MDIGPLAGENGGEVVAIGTAQELMDNPNSITGAYLSGKRKIPVPEVRRQPQGYLTVKGAQENADDGKPCDGKLSRTVWSGGKSGS